MTLAEAFEEGERLFRLRIKNQERAFKEFNKRRRENDIAKGHLKLKL